ncbi:MAG: ABC transporter permease [Spirochaetaceae bacterium]|nr:ABC transporter permease [Spirochaetaceae bacterium]
MALLASTPMYADGVLQRLLTRDLERHQVRTGRYPGTAVLEVDLYALRRRAARAPYVYEMDRELTERLVPSLRVPTIAEMRQLRMDYLYDNRPSESGTTKVFARVEAIEDLGQHVEITHGRMFEPAAGAPAGDGTDVYEAVVTAEAVRELELQLGRTYQLHDLLGHVPRLKIKVVGVFTKSDPRDPFWFGRFSRLSTSYLVDFSTFERHFLETEARNMTRAYWHYAIDYHQLTIRDVPHVMRRYQDYVRLAAPAGVSFSFAIAPLLESYLLRAAILERTLSFLQIPSALLLLLFVAMLSRLVIDGDRNEIAVLKSRGAAGRQILSAYLIEALLLGAVGLVLGLPLAVFIVRVIGASNGFLDFVARPALPLLLSWRMLGFALLGVAIFVGSLVVPLVRTTGVSIVGLKSRHARAPRSLPWQRYLLDFVLLGVAGYAFVSFRQRRTIQELIPAESAPLDPLLFLASTAFILGAGLLTLRLFPIVVRLVFRLGRRLWSPAVYAGLVQVSRSRGREYFAMIFLILTLGVGLASSTTARTINRSAEDDISYQVGADIALLPEFQSDAPPENVDLLDPLAAPAAPSGAAPAVQYRAPPLGPFRALPGVERLTTVFRAPSASMVIPGSSRVALQVMAVVPHEFGRTTWFRNDLLPAHINHHLNLIADHPTGILLSADVRDRGVRLGDLVRLTWKRQLPIQAVVLGFVDYWPSFDPNAAGRGRTRTFAVANFDYVFAKMATEPYELWMDLERGAQSGPLYAAVEEQELRVLEIRDTSQLTIEAKNDPLLQGTNGVLTFGFLTAVLVSVTGYVLFLVFALRERTLQFGLLRALGVHRRQVVGMLVLEQLLTGGFAIVAGLAIGQIAALLYVPLLQLAGPAAEQILPFRVVALRSDYLRFYVLALVILVAGAVLFQSLVRRLRVHEALKLGEE